MRTGLMRLLRDPRAVVGRARVGLVVNATAVDERLHHAADLLANHRDINVVRLFGPEHGIRGDAQDMILVRDAIDPRTRLPVTSLYGPDEASLIPSDKALSELDALVFDAQDVGSRYYTYAATMALCMRAARRAGIKMVVLDRPNPIGGVRIEGGGLQPGLESFVGLYPIPQRHALTVGELARLYNSAFSIGCELQVVACEGWRRASYYDETGLAWVMPSPNMPTVDTALVYPGMCLVEGTELSEGRGTTRPFELVGAPFVDGHALARLLVSLGLPGVTWRACGFSPTFHKHAGRMCGGVQLHVSDRDALRPYACGLAVLWAVKMLWPDEFQWRTRAYEFRSDVPAIDLLTGQPAVRRAIDGGAAFEAVLGAACCDTQIYDASRAGVLLYE